VEDPRASAEILLAHTLKIERIDLYIRYDQPLSSRELALFKAFLKRRINREPVAYIVGVKEFWSMGLWVSKDVLIPRPETECLVEAALSILPESPCPDSTLASKRILELGTGSGAIILALASRRPMHRFFASDCSVKAVEMAKQNATRHGLDKTIDFVSGSWFESFSGDRHCFDMIISNPPYIPTRDIPGLQPEIAMYEPIVALDGGDDGLCCLRHIISTAYDYLNRNGNLLVEIGHDQKHEIEKIVDNFGKYERISFAKDYSGYNRVAQIRKNVAKC